MDFLSKREFDILSKGLLILLAYEHDHQSNAGLGLAIRLLQTPDNFEYDELSELNKKLARINQ